MVVFIYYIVTLPLMQSNQRSRLRLLRSFRGRSFGLNSINSLRSNRIEFLTPHSLLNGLPAEAGRL